MIFPAWQEALQFPMQWTEVAVSPADDSLMESLHKDMLFSHNCTGQALILIDLGKLHINYHKLYFGFNPPPRNSGK